MMACQFHVMLNEGLPIHGGDVAITALDRIEILESLLSIYKSESELSRLNQKATKGPEKVSTEVISLLELGHQIHLATHGAFDMTAASLSEAWGFARRQGHQPTPDQIADAVSKVGMQFVEFDRSNQLVQFHREGLRLNSGGIGKGFAIDEASAIMKEKGIDDFLIHGGQSSVLAQGNRYDIDSTLGWRVAVSHPEQPKLQLGAIRLVNQALGTSGPANQFFYYNGVRYGHIIDPRTGWPASGMLSVTVLHPSAAWADALATGLYVMGIEQAIAYCEKHTDTGMIAILPTKRQSDVEIVTCNVDESTWTKVIP
jgi:thiamine biosynthesis lipoprotein